MKWFFCIPVNSELHNISQPIDMYTRLVNWVHVVVAGGKESGDGGAMYYAFYTR